MKTNYDDEATQYHATDKEATQYEESYTSGHANKNTSKNDEAEVKASKSKGWQHSAVGAGSGLLIGGVSTVLMGMKSADPEQTDGKHENNNHRDELSNPEWVDEEIQVATSVNDDMSFGEAFAAARAEVGPGGCFEWHGNVYGTYTADEWNHMTAEQRAEWSDHFSWNHIDHSSSSVAQHSTTSHTNPTEQAHTNDDDDIEIVSVNHENNQNNVAQYNTHTEQTGNQEEYVDGPQVEGPTEEAEIEILGVVHDNETGQNIGSMTVNGHDVIFIDVDGDMEFDYMECDINGNGEVDQNEHVDIQGQGLTVNDFGGFINTTGDGISSNDTSDYSTDIYEG